MPIGHWIKSWSAEQLPEKSDRVMMVESLFMELDYQIFEAEERIKERERQERQAKGGADYRWLTNPVVKSYEMSPLKRLELEELFMKVKPSECGRVIGMFRDTLLSEPPVEEYPGLMRIVVHQVLEGRPKEDTIPEWISKSLTSLTKIPKLSRKITPISQPSESDVENQRSDVTSVFSISSLSLSDPQASSYHKTGNNSFGSFDNFTV